MTITFKKTAVAAALVACFNQQVSYAEETNSVEQKSITALEVIEVTAQKRVQSLQDVPASITTMDGNKLADAGISQMEEMSEYVPNFTVTKSGQGYNIYMRGLGSGPNQGFEQTVGTYVDGIYRGRAVLMRSAFLDVDMVEVLRGPQGTLFGMNTTAGALNITSKNATDEFEATIKGYYVPEFNKQDLEFAVSGGLSDDLRARVALKYESDDGYIENVVTGNDEPERENIAARVTFDWDITDKLKAMKARHIMLVADSCFSGTLTRGLQRMQFEKENNKSVYYDRMYKKQSRTVLSSGGIEPVVDGGGGGHSIFAKAFIDSLKDNARIIDGTDFFHKIRQRVVVGAEQTPEYSTIRFSGHDGGDYLFIQK